MNYPFTPHYYVVLFITAFLLRAFTFSFYIHHNERFRQPDTLDYHNCGLTIYLGYGMHRPDKTGPQQLEPIFWRTPGYPAYLSIFYKLFGVHGPRLEHTQQAISAALWTQIVINSCIPLIILLLAFFITNSTLLAAIAAWIVVLHPGFILASTFLLSEGLALIFFFLFLLFFYYSLQKNQWFYVIFAAIMLAITTWIRPMGQFVAIIAMGLLLLFDHALFRVRLKKVGLFCLIFFALLFPWYWRNYNITGQWFFCPMFGIYLNTFNAPKIVRRIKSIPLIEATKQMYDYGHHEWKLANRNMTDPSKVIAKETAVGQLAYQILWAHPFYALYDWIKEVAKTTFDLYSYQMVTLYNNTFKYDPIEEFVTIKWTETLWQKPLPILVRILAWIEVIYMLLLWIGIILGLWFFIIVPFFTVGFINLYHDLNRFWLIGIFIAGTLVFMTGGFGYARLRLPAEPLFIIASLLGWYHWFIKHKNG